MKSLFFLLEIRLHVTNIQRIMTQYIHNTYTSFCTLSHEPSPKMILLCQKKNLFEILIGTYTIYIYNIHNSVNGLHALAIRMESHFRMCMLAALITECRVLFRVFLFLFFFFLLPNSHPVAILTGVR